MNDLWEVNVKGKKCSKTFEISVIRQSNQLGHQGYGWFDTTKLLISHNNGASYDCLTEKVWNKMIALAHQVAHEMNVEEFGDCYRTNLIEHNVEEAAYVVTN